MANPTNFPGDIEVAGDLRIGGSVTPALTRANILALAELQPFIIPWTDWRVWDAMQTNLPGTPLTDDLGLVGGTFATDPPSIQTEDLKAAGATTSYARTQIALPWHYEASQTVTLRFHAGMITTVSDGTATLDVQCYESDEEVGISADICATAARSINSLVFADMDFTITDAGLVAGDLLDVRIAIAINDGATGTAVIGCIGAAKLLCDVR